MKDNNTLHTTPLSWRVWGPLFLLLHLLLFIVFFLFFTFFSLPSTFFSLFLLPSNCCLNCHVLILQRCPSSCSRRHTLCSTCFCFKSFVITFTFFRIPFSFLLHILSSYPVITLPLTPHPPPLLEENEVRVFASSKLYFTAEVVTATD